MSSSFAAADLLAYGRERIANWRVAALVLGVAGLACAAHAPRSPEDVLLRTALAGLLVTTFRLWDDLADRVHDLAHHPERVLVRTAATTCFWLALLVLAGISFGAIAALGGAAGVSMYALLLLLLALVYHSAWQPVRFMRDQLVLLKYPAFIAMLTTSSFSWRSTLFGAIGYLLVSVFDWHEDSTLRMNLIDRRLTVMLAVGLIVLLALAAGGG